MIEKIRVLLVDDQVLFVESLKTVLETRTKDIEVVGIARNGNEAIQLVRNDNPDVLLMDVRMPDMDGVESTRLIHEEHPQVRILMLTTFDDDVYVHDALQYGAVGYLLKDMPPSELIATIRAAKEGASLMSPTVVSRLIQQSHSTARPESSSRENADLPEWFQTLTGREREILGLLVEGYENKQISEKLFLAEQTVKNHVSTIYAKMGVQNRIQAMKLAYRIASRRTPE